MPRLEEVVQKFQIKIDDIYGNSKTKLASEKCIEMLYVI